MTVYLLECYPDPLKSIVCGVFDREENADAAIWKVIAERKEAGEDWYKVGNFCITPLEMDKTDWLD